MQSLFFELLYSLEKSSFRSKKEAREEKTLHFQKRGFDLLDVGSFTCRVMD
jgi:hypothetical protein